jgi:hypothetical protein
MAEAGFITAVKDFFQQGKELVVSGFGKLGIETATGGKILTTPAAGAPLAGFGAAGGAMIGLGAVAGLSTITSQMEFNHQKQKLAEFYNEEISAKLKKQLKNVSGRDAETLSDGDEKQQVEKNHTLEEAISKQRKIRNITIATSFVATIAAVALVGAAFPPVAGVAAAHGIGSLLLHGTIGLLSYLAIKAPLNKIARAAFGVSKETTNDKIMHIAKDRESGKSITREQVVGVFISANPELGHFVEDHFGKAYDKLVLADKVAVAKEIANLAPVDKIVENINLGVTNVSELAFTVEGQMSGVMPKLPERSEQPTAMQAFALKCRQMARKVSTAFHKDHGVATHHFEELEPRALQGQGLVDAPLPELLQQQQAVSFANRVASKGQDPSLSYAERIVQSRGEIDAPTLH